MKEAVELLKRIFIFLDERGEKMPDHLTALNEVYYSEAERDEVLGEIEQFLSANKSEESSVKITKHTINQIKEADILQIGTKNWFVFSVEDDTYTLTIGIEDDEESNFEQSTFTSAELIRLGAKLWK